MHHYVSSILNRIKKKLFQTKTYHDICIEVVNIFGSVVTIRVRSENLSIVKEEEGE